jgi:serine/threonine-protein kinase
MPLADELRLLLDVAAGLAHAHRAGVVHRDVKPGNLRLLPDGRVKILDFGIARDLGAATALTGDDRAVGTLAYMAPEQARGQKPDARADVHAWGAVAFELLSGRRAVPGDSPAVLVYQLLEGKPPPLLEVAPETPEELAALVDRCLARDPAARPRDGGELLAALEPLAKRLVPSAELAAPAAPWGTRPEARRRGAWLAGASAAAALVVVIVAAWLAWHGSPGGPPVVSPARGLAGAGAQASAAPPGASNAVSPAPAPPLSPAGGASAAIAVATAPPGPAPLPAPSAAPTLAALPSPAGAPPAPAAATGVLQVDARPWGELVRLVAADGRELALPADAVTPLALTLPAGDYTAVLRHPQAGGERSCTAHVEAGGRALCRVELRALRASDLLGGAAS